MRTKLVPVFTNYQTIDITVPRNWNLEQNVSNVSFHNTGTQTAVVNGKKIAAGETWTPLQGTVHIDITNYKITFTGAGTPQLQLSYAQLLYFIPIKIQDDESNKSQ